MGVTMDELLAKFALLDINPDKYVHISMKNTYYIKHVVEAPHRRYLRSRSPGADGHHEYYYASRQEAFAALLSVLTDPKSPYTWV
jgi:hypothetical protein